MISDVPSEATHDILKYLDKCPDAYPPHHPLTQRIKECAMEMEAIRIILDAPPYVTEADQMHDAMNTEGGMDD